MKMTLKWWGEQVKAGYRSQYFPLADFTSQQARYLSKFIPHSWTETYQCIFHEFHAFIFILLPLFLPYIYLFPSLFKKGWAILLSRKCNCTDGQFFEALKSLHFFATVSLHTLKNLGFADLGTVLQQNNKPEINSLAILSCSFLPEFLIKHSAFFIYLPSKWSQPAYLWCVEETDTRILKR